MVAATNPDDAASFWRPHLRLRHRTGTVHLLAFLAARSQRVLLNSMGAIAQQARKSIPSATKNLSTTAKFD
jgi:hypothetical protein